MATPCTESGSLSPTYPQCNDCQGENCPEVTGALGIAVNDCTIALGVTSETTQPQLNNILTQNICDLRTRPTIEQSVYAYPCTAPTASYTNMKVFKNGVLVETIAGTKTKTQLQTYLRDNYKFFTDADGRSVIYDLDLWTVTATCTA